MSSTPVYWPNDYTKLESTTKTWQWYGLTKLMLMDPYPHQLIQVAMHQYYIPDHSSNLIMNYFNNNHLRFSRSRFTTTSFKNVLPQGFIASSLSNCLSWFKHDYQGSKKGHQGKHLTLPAIQQEVYWRHYSHHNNQHTRQMDPQGF